MATRRRVRDKQELTQQRPEADVGLPSRVAVVGAGVIGAAWAARWALRGVEVTVADPSPGARASVEQTLEAACSAWRRLGLLADGQPSLRVDDGTPAAAGERSVLGHVEGLERESGDSFEAGVRESETTPPERHGSQRGSGHSFGKVAVADPTAGCSVAVADAELIHECVPERLDLKQAVYAEIEAAAVPDAVIASSTSGIRPSELQTGMRHPERLVVGHPFNPVYLLPLVEVVGGAGTSAHTIERAMGWFAAAGMSPLRVRSEIDGFVADRLLEALWREALWLVHDGVATVAEIDDAIRLGFGLRWAQMGVFQTYATAGGEGGFRHFIEHFAPTLGLPWTKLTDVPEMTPEFMRELIAQESEQSKGQSVAELCAARDRNLVDMLLALEANDWGAGRSLAALRRRCASGD